MEKVLTVFSAISTASHGSHAEDNSRKYIAKSGECPFGPLFQSNRKAFQNHAITSRYLVIPMSAVPFSCSQSHQMRMPARCSFIGTTRKGNMVAFGSYDSGFVCELEEVGTHNWSVDDGPSSSNSLEQKPHHWGTLAVDKELDLEPRCRPPLSKSECLSVSDRITILPEMSLHFLEERDERILSKRIVSLSRDNKVRSALELYSSMELAGIKPTPHACNSLLSCILRNGSLDDALRVFQVMRKKDVATGHTYSLILKAIASSQGCDSALQMFMDIEMEGISNKSFDVIVYNTMISVCGKAKKWIEAERMWRKLKENGLHGTTVTYSLLISSFVQCAQTELALSAYGEMIQNGYEPGEDVMKGIISSCTKEGKWALALDVFNRMLDNDIKPNIIVFNSMINCLGKAGEADLAFKIYDLLKSSGHNPDTYTWNALLSSLYRCKRYADCIKLFESINKLKNFEMNSYLYDTALMSCQKLGLWDRSLQLLWQMEASGLQMSTASCNLVIGACEIARKPKVALQVYQHMVHRKCLPDTFTYLTLIRACVWGSLWTEVERILEHVEPNASLSNALIHGFCLRGKITLAKKLYSKMRSSGLKPDGKTRALMLQHISNDLVRLRHPRYVNVKQKGVRRLY